MQYETPLNVVPTSNASTSFRVKPSYGFRGSILSSNLKVAHSLCRTLYMPRGMLHFEVDLLRFEVRACGPRVIIACKIEQTRVMHPL